MRSNDGGLTEREAGGPCGGAVDSRNSVSALKVETGLYVFPTLVIELSVSVPVILAVPPPTSGLHGLQAVLRRSQPIKISLTEEPANKR